MPYSQDVENARGYFDPSLVGPPPSRARGDVTLTRSEPCTRAVPVLHGTQVTLRELVPADAPSLFALLTEEDVTRFVAPPPSTLTGFQEFVAWAHRQREAGQYVCFAVVPHQATAAIGLIQMRSLGADFQTTELGCVLGSAYWGTGVFLDGARLTIRFAFETLGARRLEMRAVTHNARGNGALRKIGARQEDVLRGSLEHRGRRYDQGLWILRREDWEASALGG